MVVTSQQLLLLSSNMLTEQVPSQVCVMKAFSTSHALSHSERPHQSHAWAVVLTSVEKTRRRSLEFEVAAPPSPRHYRRRLRRRERSSSNMNRRLAAPRT